MPQARALGPVGEGRGRLIFALDATMSRQPTWDTACKLQGEMFKAAGEVGGLDVQLVYFRGFGECRASRWVSDAQGLTGLMTAIDCRGGHTQIGKILTHARRETAKKKVGVLVFVGDALEEPIDTIWRPRPANSASSASRSSSSRKDATRRSSGASARLRVSRSGAYARFDVNAAGELAAAAAGCCASMPPAASRRSPTAAAPAAGSSSSRCDSAAMPYFFGGVAVLGHPDPARAGFRVGGPARAWCARSGTASASS